MKFWWFGKKPGKKIRCHWRCRDQEAIATAAKMYLKNKIASALASAPIAEFGLMNRWFSICASLSGPSSRCKPDSHELLFVLRLYRTLSLLVQQLQHLQSEIPVAKGRQLQNMKETYDLSPTQCPHGQWSSSFVIPNWYHQVPSKMDHCSRECIENRHLLFREILLCKCMMTLCWAFLCVFAKLNKWWKR